MLPHRPPRRQLLESGYNGIVVVDEAYVDFADGACALFEPAFLGEI